LRSSPYFSVRSSGVVELCNFAQYGHSKSEYSSHVILASTFPFTYELLLISASLTVSRSKNQFALLSTKGSNEAFTLREYSSEGSFVK